MTNDQGGQVAFVYWWQMTNPAIYGNRIEWSNGIQRLAVIGPVNSGVAQFIATAASDPDRFEKYQAAHAAAVEADRKETYNLSSAKAAKDNGNTELTAEQAAALRNDRNRKFAFAGGGTLVVAVIAGFIGLANADSGSKDNIPSSPEAENCTWDWVPGKAPVDVGWSNAVQYCYPN